MKNYLTAVKNLNLTKNKKHLSIIVFLLIVVVAVASWLLISNFTDSDKKLYAKVAGHEIYEEEVRDFIGDNDEDVSEREATEVLADKYLLEKLAEEEGVTISKQEIIEEFGEEFYNDQDEDKYGYQYQVNELYLAKLSANNVGIYKGKLLVTHFSRHIPYKSALLEEQKAYNPKLGDPQAIASDKKYAEDLITRLHNQIESGEITFEEAIENEHKDSRVGREAYPTLSHSGSFDNSIREEGLIGLDRVRERIKDLQPGQMSEPFAAEVSDSESGNSTVESYFLVVQIDEKQGGESNMEFEEYLDDSKGRLGYEIYT